MRRASVAAASLLVLLASCDGGGAAAPSPSASPSGPGSPEPSGGSPDVGGYELSYECEGEGEPTVILEAGLGAAGTEEFFGFIDQVAEISRVCTYDRAGTGVSDARPDGEHVTAGLMADELHRLLESIGEGEPVVLVGHSYGGMPVRAFEGTYPDDVAGMVLIDVSSEPEVPVYERLDAGPWIDRTDRIDIHATVDELHAAGDLDDIPVIVVTAGILEDEWLATVPVLAARAQARLASLSSNSYQVVAPDSGHFVHRDAPNVVLAAIETVVSAARSGSELAPCAEAFVSAGAICVPPGQVPELAPA
jgi:pimeloyl-ACP methyl ester carboxylesterase